MSALTKISVALCVTLAAIVAGCSTDRPKIQATLNERASLTGNLPANPLAWQIVTSTIDKSKSEMSTLYGNDVAVVYARSHADHNYPAGSVLALVCWTQTDDPRYFGARIPGRSKSVEFVTVSADSDGHPTYLDQFYDGTPLQKASEERSSAPTERATRILSLRSAVFP